ncbi:MAG: hypothetical protein ACYTGG_13295 [Planctomycetota bacterium]|jgi:hypothetical protein
MHETRNFVMVLLLAASLVWAFVAWLLLGEAAPALWAQRIFATLLALSLVAWLFYALRFEDKLPDHLETVVGEMYYEADGLSFMPIVRVHNGRAELCVYYQNRFENPVQAIVHLRPPADSFVIRPGLRDVHFAFRADGGDFGAIHQPIAVPGHLQGEVINVQLAAASWYPRSHGARFRRRGGLPCGTLPVDWGGSAFKTGVYESSGEIQLNGPATLHLPMPKNVHDEVTGSEVWTQEQIEAGVTA